MKLHMLKLYLADKNIFTRIVIQQVILEALFCAKPITLCKTLMTLNIPINFSHTNQTHLFVCNIPQSMTNQ